MFQKNPFFDAPDASANSTNWFVGINPDANPWLLAGLTFVCINLLAYVLFTYDKQQARYGGWRIPEKTLLGIALIGGSPAILIARKRHRHKTRKQPFVGQLFSIVALQVLGGIAVIYLGWTT